MCYTINQNVKLNGYVSQLVGCILKFFNDPSDRVRFSAISSIYNVFKFLDDDCLAVFTRTFKELPCIIMDPSAEVRQAAAHLNHTMKTLLNNAILGHQSFDYEDFVNILTENFLHPHPVIKEFLIDWINTIDQIKQFEITKYLPLFLKKLFLFLVDENKNVRIKAQECLNGFIEAFKLCFTCSKQQITKRYKQEQTQSILILLIKIIQESIVFECSSDIDIHVFTWLDSFCSFLIEEINQGLEPFLTKIFIKIFQPVFDVMIQAFSIQPENIQVRIVNIHSNLLKAYPFLYSHSSEIEQAATNFEKALLECTCIVKTQIVLKWINRMADNNNQYINNKIEKFIDFIIQKVCQFSTKNIAVLFELLEGSIFTSQYFSIFIHSLLTNLENKRNLNETGILSEIVNFSNSQYCFIMLCSQINDLGQGKQSPFKIRVAQTLISFLITQKSLRSFRESIKKRKTDPKIFRTMSLCLAQSKAAFILLCFLIQDYDTVIYILNHENESEIGTNLMHSLFKICNLIMHPSMHQIFIDMGSKGEISEVSRRAYLSLLMFLPINRMTSALFFKAKQLSRQEEIGFVYFQEKTYAGVSSALQIYKEVYEGKLSII